MNQSIESATRFGSYPEAVEWITGLIAEKGMRPGLKRMEWLMKKLGHPERRLKFIHVAGTNGKGSTCAFLTKILLQNGYDVGTFTSPYLTKFTDRLRYNDQDIEEDQLLALANEIKPLAEELAQTELGHPTMFEVTTTIALLYFARVVYPDYVVWEVGMGGRLDSTNVVLPVVSVITNIGHDHKEFLGESLEEIAVEKAGIIKPGVPVVTTVEQPEALAVIEEASARNRSSIYRLGREFSFQPLSTELHQHCFTFESPFRRMKELQISLNGIHQFQNASAALMAIEVLRQYQALIIEEDDLYSALKETFWPGRLEFVGEQPQLLLDGAHNPEGAQSLAKALEASYSYGKLHMMLGMISGKEHEEYLRQLLPLADTLIITEPEFHKKYDAADLAQTARQVADELGRPVEICVERNWRQAIAALQQITGESDLGVVTGTLYLISDVRSVLKGEAQSEKGW